MNLFILIIVRIIRQKRKEDKRDTGIDESIIEELTKARKESSGFHKVLSFLRNLLPVFWLRD